MYLYIIRVTVTYFINEFDFSVQYPFDDDSNSIALVFGTNDNITNSGFQILFQQISICEEDLNGKCAQRLTFIDTCLCF